MMDPECQSTELVFYPWSGHKPLEQGRIIALSRAGSGNVPLVLEKTPAGIQSFWAAMLECSFQ